MVVKLGNTNLIVSRIGLGTVKIGRNADVKYPKAFSLPDDDEVTALLSMARELGINLVDTAPAYGESERRLGKLLPGDRHDWVICTKCGEQYSDQGSSYDFSQKALEESVQQSLVNLKTDYLDIVLIHSDGNDLSIIENSDAVPTLERLKKNGLIRYIGMSTKTVEGGIAAASFSDILMVTLNLEDKTQLPVIEKANKAGTGVLLKKVFASGFQEPSESLTYALNVPGVHAAVVGTINPIHLKKNCEAVRQAAIDL